MEFLHGLENQLWAFLESLYTTVGWAGVVVMMAIESACIPLPSEIIMPLSGQYLVKDPGNWFALLEAGFYGALGCTIGSAIAYWVGALGGRPIIEKYGKYVLIRHHHLDVADRWFARWGEATAFFSRLVPIVRTFISFPAGVARMNFPKFLLYTFLGSFPWSLALAWAGAQWKPREVREFLRPFDIPIALVILALVAWFVYRSWRNRGHDEPVAVTAGTGRPNKTVSAARAAPRTVTTPVRQPQGPGAKGQGSGSTGPTAPIAPAGPPRRKSRPEANTTPRPPRHAR
jgi:membrane protein DedA with SNARE-associated domain